MHRTLLTVLLTALLGLIPATAQAQLLRQHQQHEEPDINMLRKLQMAQLAITELYVDTIDQNKLAEAAIEGMLKTLDPHSAYANAESTRSSQEALDGNFEGIGIQFNMLEDTLVVIQGTERARRHHRRRPHRQRQRTAHSGRQHAPRHHHAPSARTQGHEGAPRRRTT